MGKTVISLMKREVSAMAKEAMKMVAGNKKAYHDYFIDEKYEAGIELHGTEVKSLRMGKCSIKESFVRIENGEAFVYGMNISPYEKGNIFNKDPLRIKKLLLHKAEINRLAGKMAEKGFTLVPSRYIEFVNRDENIDFDTKMKSLQGELKELLVQEEKSKSDLLAVFKELGYEIEL